MGEWVRDHLIVLFILYYSKQNVCGIGCVRNKRKIFFPAVNCCLFFCFVSGCVYAEDLFPDTLMPCFFFSPNRVLIFIPRYYHHLSPASPHHDTNSRRSLKTETTNQPTVTLLYRKSINLVLVLLLQPTCFILTHSFCYSVLHNTIQFSTNISPPSFNLLV